MVMKQKHQYKRGMLTQLRGWLLVMMLTIPALQMQADDWVLNESKYNAVMEDDHLHLEAFIADLDRTNTYSKGGFIYASNGLTTIKLLYLEYINDGDEPRYGGPFRYRSDKWNKIYKNRTSTKRVNNRVLNDYHLHQMKIRDYAKNGFFSIMAGIMNLSNVSEVGKMGRHMMGLYLLTSLCAAGGALFLHEPGAEDGEHLCLLSDLDQ